MNNNSVPYKLDDFESHLQKIRRLYIQSINDSNFLSPAQRILRECDWTEVMLQQLSCGNTFVFRSFRLRLEMEVAA